MLSNKLIEYIFFFAILGGVAFLTWKLLAPFSGAIALAAIIVTICYPVYERILARTPKRNASLAAFLTVLFVVLIVFFPLVVIGSFILREALSMYSLVNSTTYLSFSGAVEYIEALVGRFIPGFSLDLSSFIAQAAEFIASHLVSFFAGTASTLFLFFIALISSFYFFRDGKTFTNFLIQISPLKNVQDELIIKRLSRSIRSVALGTVLVALIQGVLTGVGLSLFGFEHAVLWGAVAAIGALVPGVGTTIVFIPAVIYLIVTGSHLLAGGLAVWGVIAVGMIDNMLGPYLMSRGNSLHPLLILLSVLGGIVLFGPIGFILGPVIISLFTVLLELYAIQVRKGQS